MENKEPKWLSFLSEDRQKELREKKSRWGPLYDNVNPQTELLMEIINLLKRKE